MEGCLEGADEDPFDYAIKHNEYIATKKDGKTYFHFCNGLVSSAVSMKFYPCVPRRVRLMNTGKDLAFCAERLPEYFVGKSGMAEDVYLHITGIPADELVSEAVVLEVEW